MSHFIEKCQYDFTHDQCRCPDPNKAVRRVECNNPRHASILAKPNQPISKPLVIGLTGFAGSGKDTVGADLVRRGWKRVSLAEPLKQLSLAIDPIITKDMDGPVRLADLVNAFGWEHTKWNYPEARQFLQRLGNESRNIIRDDVWVMIAESHIKNWTAGGISVVLTDVRYPNEAEMIRSLPYGFVVKVERPNVGPINDHISDKGLHPSLIDAVLPNDGTLDEIPGKVDDVLNEIS
jgi:hypothetical protein